MKNVIIKATVLISIVATLISAMALDTTSSNAPAYIGMICGAYVVLVLYANKRKGE